MKYLGYMTGLGGVYLCAAFAGEWQSLLGVVLLINAAFIVRVS